MAAAFKLLFICAFLCFVKLSRIQCYTTEGKNEVNISDNLEEVHRNRGNRFHSISRNIANKQNFNRNHPDPGAALTESNANIAGKQVMQSDRNEPLGQTMMHSWQNVIISKDKVVKPSTSRKVKFSGRNMVHDENIATTSIRNIMRTSTGGAVRFAVEDVNQILSQNKEFPGHHKTETWTQKVELNQSVTNASSQNEIRTSTESPVIDDATQMSSQKVTEIETSAENVALSQSVIVISSQNKIQTSTENAGALSAEDVTETSSQNITEIPGNSETETTTLTFLNDNVTKISYNVTGRYTPFPVTPLPPEQEIIRECETPNYDKGYCIEIKKCPILVNQVNNNETWSFIRASKCGEYKVCCGKYSGFRNVSKNIVQGDVLPKSCGRQKQLFRTRIFGGTEACLGEYPWMALIIQKSKAGETILGCAGFLIDTKFVITAAHCTHPNIIKQRGPIVSVLLGEHNIQTTSDCVGKTCVNNIQNCRIAKVITHPDFSPNDTAYHNDIAIIKLKTEAVLTDYVQPICLIKNYNQTSTKYHISGWGNTEKGIRSDVKMKIELPHFDKVQCIEKYSQVNIKIQDSQICVGGEYQKDSCSGDSGGPLMMSKDEIWYASGIVSFGLGCGEMGWPGVYTNIGKFLPWIKSQITQT